MMRLHPGPMSLATAGAFVFSFATVGSAIVLGRVTDDIVLPAFEPGATVSTSDVWLGALAILGITVLRSVGVVGRRYFGMMTGERVQQTIRHSLATKFTKLPLSWFQKHPTGQLLAHADNDSEIAAQVIMPLPFTLGVFFLAIFSAISLLLVDVPLAVLAFLVFPALAGLNRIYSRVIEVPAAKVQEDIGQVSSVAHESFDGALIVKTLGRAEAEEVRFGEEVEQLRSDRVRVGYLTAAFDTVIDMLPNLGIVAVIVIGAYRIDAGAVTPGELVQVASLFSVLSFPMRVFGFFLTSLPPAVVATERLTPVFQTPLPDAAPTDLKLPDGPLGLDVANVHFAYPDTPVLEGVTFRALPGETVAVVGSTGSGKSTLCALLAGLLPPDSGTVLLGDPEDGVPVGALDVEQRAAAMSLVFQESFLFGSSLRGNIDLHGDRGAAAVERAADIAQVSRFMDEMADGLDTVVGERGVTLSGGQRQRVALARALIGSPRLLILDDATSAVDAEVEQQILRGLREAVDATVVIVAQRVSTIEVADRVVYVANGRVVAQGAHAELMAHPGYESLVRAYEQAAS